MAIENQSTYWCLWKADTIRVQLIYNAIMQVFSLSYADKVLIGAWIKEH